MNWMVPYCAACATFVVKVKPPGLDVAPHHLEQTRLVDWNAAVLEDLDLGRIQVQAQHIVTHIRQTGARHQPHIAGPDG